MLDEESLPLTTFTVGLLGFYKCVWMPFGLMNMPATFQRLVESCSGDLHACWCLSCLDDVIIFSETPAKHISCLGGAFEKLSQVGLKLKPSKCSFFWTEISYLEHIVSEKGIETDPKKIAAIRDWPQPKTVMDIRSFLGFTNYYQKFIYKYTHVARPHKTADSAGMWVLLKFRNNPLLKNGLLYQKA